MVGCVLWADGTPAQGARVTAASTSTATDASGAFKLSVPYDADDDGARPEQVSVLVDAPCWVDNPLELKGTAVALDDGSLHLETLRIPNRIDVRIQCTSDRSTVDHLLASGYTHLIPTVTDASVAFFPPVIGKSRAPLRPGISSFTLEVFDCTLVRFSIAAGQDSTRTPGPHQYLTNGEDVLRLTRDAPGLFEIILDGRNLLTGVVVDHTSRPIPRAKVNVRIPQPSSPRGFRETRLRADDQGRFVFLDAPGTNVNVTAKHLSGVALFRSVIVTLFRRDKVTMARRRSLWAGGRAPVVALEAE